MANEHHPSFFEEGIKLISFCPLCQAKEEKMEVSVLEKTEAGRLIHLKCRHCRASILALIMISPSGLNSVGMITDLSAEEVVKFKETDRVGADEVLEFSQFICQEKEWLARFSSELET